ncbi:unnamed protein product [Caenorhabditis brenneri]
MLMKIIPIFIVFLSIGSFAQSVEPDPEQAEFIENVNKLRRKSAIEYGISNMHELTYNRSLAQIAGSQNYKTSGYLFTNLPINDKIWDTFVENVLTFKQLDSQTREIYGKDPQKNLVWYFANPSQTKIGCAKSSNRIVCVFGSHKVLSGWENPDKNPGSECMQGYDNSDGLCVWKLEQKKFIAYLNEERRSFAKKNDVNNMHKLAFSPFLAFRASVANWTGDDFDGARVTWRYTVLKNFENASQELKESMDYLNRHSKEMKLDIYKKRVNLYFQPYEHLVPLQKFVGCAVRTYVVCLFGPAATFSMSDFANTQAGCEDNYILKDGLCTRSVPVATTPDANSGSQVTVIDVDPSKDQNHPVAKIHPTTIESELDRRIAEYKANEQDGDLPSKDDLEEITVSDSEDVSFLISVSFLLASMLYK